VIAGDRVTDIYQTAIIICDMKCWVCHRELSADEPVWRGRIRGLTKWEHKFHFSILYACDPCRQTSELRKDVFAGRTRRGGPTAFRSRPCSHCQRPVFFDAEPSGRFVCGPECRQALDDAKHRRLPTQNRCTGCGAAFTALRYDARFCSARCRQRAVRAR